MRRSDVLKTLLLCVCLRHVCPAHPCGDNPLMLVDEFSRERGFDAEAMLQYMREEVPAEYEQLVSDYWAYLECTQMVHTGYFKRSVDSQEEFDSERSENLNDVDKQFRNKYGETMKLLFGERQQVPIVSRNNFNSMSAIDIGSLDNPRDNQDDLPFIIKRLLRGRQHPKHQKRNRRLRAKVFMDV